MAMGAATFHPATTLYSLGPKPWNVAFVQPSRRPQDGRYGYNPNRVQKYFQFQVILKPSPDNVQDLLLQSFACVGLDPSAHDIRFVEDDWQSPSLGASGLGWEVWCDGMEVTQFTYFQQVGGIVCSPVSAEITYGLERVAMAVQKKDSMFDIDWNKHIKYSDFTKRAEYEFSVWNFEEADTDVFFKWFEDNVLSASALLQKNLVLPAYELCIKTSHAFNILEARSAISVTQRAQYIQRIRSIACACCKAWIETGGADNVPV